jgi:amino acid adenylation domain-containing protein
MEPTMPDQLTATDPAVVPAPRKPAEQRSPAGGVHELFARHAAARPDRIALSGQGMTLTYGELDARANQLAHHLIALGLTRDQAVCVFLERSAQFIIAMLAICKAGGNYVPMDPNYPAARLQVMIARTGASVVITSAGLAERLPAGPAALRVEEFPALLAGRPATDPGVPVTPEHLAYTMFTSGSTGEPKGVTVRHAGILRLVHNPGYVTFGPDDVVLHHSSTSFDAATFEIWGALANGCRLALGPAQASVVELGRTLREEGVTTTFITTGLLHLLVDERLADLSGLTQLVTGGDVLSPGRAHRVRQAFPKLRLVNGYGPTEVTTFTTAHVVTSQQDEHTAVPIGTPINRTWVRVLDADFAPAPAGETGRLYAGGDGLARGYLGDPQLTAARFVPDPWAPGERLYDTGDLARLRPDGGIDFLGRADQQIKKRGFRVEPSEIEESLRQDPLVRDAAVIGHGQHADERILVAFLQPTDDADEADLVRLARSGLRERLPEYLIPDQWQVVAELPLNANGKVDRRALTERWNQRAATDIDETQTPVGPTETELAVIWRDLFELDTVGRHDDFFDLGGHSLLASRMAARLRQQSGLEVPLAVIFDNPTIARLAALIDAVG